jgi:hypothetical protein
MKRTRCIIFCESTPWDVCYLPHFYLASFLLFFFPMPVDLFFNNFLFSIFSFFDFFKSPLHFLNHFHYRSLLFQFFNDYHSLYYYLFHFIPFIFYFSLPSLLPFFIYVMLFHFSLYFTSLSQFSSLFLPLLYILWRILPSYILLCFISLDFTFSYFSGLPFVVSVLLFILIGDSTVYFLFSLNFSECFLPLVWIIFLFPQSSGTFLYGESSAWKLKSMQL